MDLRKGADELWRLVGAGTDDLSKFAQVSALLAGFERENREIDGSMSDAYVEEKIRNVRIWFEMLCGVGEDGYENEQVRQNLRTDIGKLKGVISPDGITVENSAAAGPGSDHGLQH